MKKTITRIDPLSAAKVMALLYFIISIPLVAIMAIVSMFAPGQNHVGGLLMIIILPVMYGVFGFIFTLIGAWLYNVIAKVVGGVQYTSAEAQ